MKSKSIVSRVFTCGALVGIAYACSGTPDAVVRPQGDDGEAGEGASSGRGGASSTGGIIVPRGGSTGKGGKGGKGGTGEGGDNGQGGSIRDAGFPDVGFDYDASDDGDGGACAVVTGDATLVKRPMDIIVSIDNSGSMAGEINAVIARINTDFAQIIEASMIDYRVIMVSRYGHLNYTLGETNFSVCIGPPLGSAACTQPNGPSPVLVNQFCYWMFQIPLAWTLARTLGMGPTGVFLAITIAESLVTVVSIVCFRRGRWKTQRVRDLSAAAHKAYALWEGVDSPRPLPGVEESHP